MRSPESGFARREFLKKAGKIAVAGTAAIGAVSLIGNEITKGGEGIVRVKEGNFIPLYERHNVGISPENFPQDIDALFKEINQSLKSSEEYFEYLTDNPRAVGNLLSNGRMTDQDEIILNLSKRNAPLVLGDIYVPYIPSLIYRGSVMGVETVIGAAALIARRKITRRKFLQLGLTAVALYSSSNATELIALSTFIERPDWIKRLERIYGITSHIHPEQPLIFLRNAIMANKLLLTGKYLKEKLGRQPNIAFWVGSGHSGIEDFLQLGQEVCRKAIMLYPKAYLQHVIDDAGGSEDFSSALLAYPRATGENQYTFDLVKITDQKLLEKLRS